MCGIVGYVGERQVTPILLEGLSRLEYRGYDSAGVAVYSDRDRRLEVAKAKGRLECSHDRTIPIVTGLKIPAPARQQISYRPNYHVVCEL